MCWYLACFPSIQAWSTIVHLLIPNISQLEASLNSFATVLDADEVLLFEKATFLVSDFWIVNVVPWQVVQWAVWYSA